MKTVYLAMSVDLIHPGHINIIQKAADLGSLTVGVLSDSAIVSYKKIPYMSFDQRKNIIENIKGVSCVVVQDTLSYSDNIRNLKPNYVVHGDDWREGALKGVREELLSVLDEIGGELVEFSYTQGFSPIILDEINRPIGTTPSIRMSMLRRLLYAKPVVTVNEVHNGLSGLITEVTNVERDGKVVDGTLAKFYTLDEHRNLHLNTPKNPPKREVPTFYTGPIMKDGKYVTRSKHN